MSRLKRARSGDGHAYLSTSFKKAIFIHRLFDERSMHTSVLACA